jgi:uncharacterized protein YaaQ
MKQLVIIVQADDADAAAAGLRDAGHRFTRLASEGGFLGTINVTLIMAVEDALVDDVLSVLRATCTSRDIEVPLVLSGRLRDWQEQAVRYAGAMVIITEAVDVVRI